MIGQGFDRHWTGLDSDWTDLVNFPAFGQTLDGGWTGFGFCVQALSNQPSLRSTKNFYSVSAADHDPKNDSCVGVCEGNNNEDTK